MSKALQLTPNRRLARFLQSQEGGRFLSLNDWYLELWQTEYELIVGDQPLQCLTDWQSALLWEKLIHELHPDPLLNLSQAVQHARAAWNLSIQWQVDPHLWKGEKSETDAFIGWLDAYQKQCVQHRWVDRALLPEVLMQYWASHPKSLPSRVSFRGFDEFTPLQHAMISLWTSMGSEIEIEPPSQDYQPYQYLSFETREAQLYAAANFAKDALAQEPNLPIGIIIPAIQDDWTNIYDTLTEVLGEDQPFNISAGQPLGLTPVVYAAIECLRGSAFSYLLKTPYIAGGMEEQSSRAISDQILSALERDPLPIDFVRHHESLPEGFKLIFNRALDQLANYQAFKIYPCEWIEKIFDLLKIWGWPGDRSLNSEAYQAVTHFYQLISELSSLDEVLGPVSFSDLMRSLTQRLNQTMFQGESQDKPIQVLGFLEAAGMKFSNLWVMDMGADTWPEKPSPNPFIPISIQLALEIPHASFARELKFAQTMTARMLTSSENIVMSFASQSEEGGAANLPTALLDSSSIVHLAKPLSSVELKKSSIVTEDSPCGTPLQQAETIRGGSAIFKDQAACPFKAYAKHRLAPEQPQRPRLGLTERVKGNIVHEVLEKIWRKLKTQDHLKALDEKSLKALLTQHIKQALEKIDPPLSEVESDLETRRLIPILLDWFSIESERQPFQILELEKSTRVIFEGLPIKLRIDRLDQIGDKLCIIDYKTGKVTQNAWIPPRMAEPQLPLYACVHQPEPQAIAFAQIRKNELAWRYSDELDLEGWKEDFKTLAQEFKSGYAAVRPKQGRTTCAQCDFQAFCRVKHDD